MLQLENILIYFGYCLGFNYLEDKKLEGKFRVYQQFLIIVVY